MTKRKKSGLGKGLGALIPTSDGEAASQIPASGLQTIPVAQIKPNPYQPRTEFEESALAELAASIKEHGLIQPLIVNREPSGDYILIAGERRWRASQRAGLKEVPVVVKNDISALEMLELAIIENVQRADLNALEEALAYQQLNSEFGLTHEEIARRVGKSRPAITNTINLLDLPDRVKKAVIDGEISGGHAKAIKSLPTAAMQVEILGIVIKNGLSVRQTEELVKKRKLTQKPAAKQAKYLSAEMEDVRQQFENRLAAPVDIQDGKRGGKIVIHYTSLEEFNAIYDTIVGH